MRLKQLTENSVKFDDNFRQSITDILVFFKANGVSKTSIQNIIDELSKADIAATYDQVEKAMIDLGYEVHDTNVIIEPETEMTIPDNEEKSEPESDIKKIAKKQALK